jgi:hypothetical protein
MKVLRKFSGALLLAVAFSLFLVNWTSPSYIVLPFDPIFALSQQWLFWIIGGFALAVALICLFDDRPIPQVFILSLLATAFIAYQIWVYCVGCRGVSGYLGGLSRTFGVSAHGAGVLTMLGTVILPILSYSSVGWLWWRGKLEAKFLKMSCPSCGGHLKFEFTSLGKQVPCPHCQAAVTLRKPDENLKMSCFLCKERIEFPSHALGSIIRCPHCHKDITLRQTEAATS